ncbi:MAG: magnesium transporter CorA family protein [Parcubacteria group bacterium]|nr:magnesium transporter CorA family protein [Parcubacteria group bacterium]
MRNIIKAKHLTWIDVKGPDENDLDYLKQSFNLHPLVLKELTPPLDYPKIENFDDKYLFIVLFYPYYDRKTQRTIPLELDIIVGKDYIITNHYKDIVPLKAIFDKCNLYEDIREEYTDEGPGELVYRIIDKILAASFPKLSHIKKHIDEIEESIYSNKFQECVTKISLVKRDIIGFQRIIEPQKLVLTNLIKEADKFFDDDMQPYFNDLKNVFNRVVNLLNASRKTISALDSTNQSLLTTKTNDIIRVLTIFSVIVFPLTLLAGMFGMNTNYLPFIGKAYDFWVILGLMLIGAIVMLGIFKIKKWI